MEIPVANKSGKYTNYGIAGFVWFNIKGFVFIINCK